ncbi:hypothetical protein [Streptomyces sp. G45]|uniref:hypothetical protein n=1 Tax=Streptomyces sp. G45 TaxID=3406627 RepID=UPI003C237B6D
MTHPPHLRPEDRADFEWVLNLALDVTDIRTALDQAPASAHDRGRLRAQARESAQDIAAAAADEYRAYRRARAAVVPAARGRGEPPPPPAGRGSGAALPALAVFTPLVSAVSGAVLLFLGCGIRLATPQSPLGPSLVTAGWVCAVAAAASTALGLSGLLTTALRRRAAPAPRLTVRNPAAEQARATWHQALLERGMLPYLRRHLSVSPPRTP